MRRDLPFILVVLALFAGCGNDEETTTTTGATGATGTSDVKGPVEPVAKGERGRDASPRVAISANTKAVIGGNVRSFACGSLVTDRYLRDAYGGAQGCRSAQGTEGAFDVRVRRIEVDGDSATAVAIPLGGPNEGIETDVELVLDGDVWRVDRLRADVPAGP